MSDNDLHNAGRYAIRLLYTFLISFSVANAFRIFIDGPIEKMTCSDWAYIPIVMIFLTFILRFFIGSYVELTRDISSTETPPAKVIWDFIWLAFQAIIFILISFSVRSLLHTVILIIFLCAFDSAWILIVKYGLKQELPPSKQWLWHNCVCLFVGIMYFWLLKGIFTEFLRASILLILSLIAMGWDLKHNLDYYRGHNTLGK